MTSVSRERWLIVAAVAMAVGLVASSVVAGMLWTSGNQRDTKIAELEAQVRALGAVPVTRQPDIIVVTPSTTMLAPAAVPFPPSTVPAPPANPPTSAPPGPAQPSQPSTTTTTAPPAPTPTTTPCTTLPVVRVCTPGRASRSGTRTDLNWEALRQCESGGDYSTNTGNGYYGAYQFSLGTWQGLGYEGLPSDASPETQDEAAQRLYADRGAQPWPVCGRYL